MQISSLSGQTTRSWGPFALLANDAIKNQIGLTVVDSFTLGPAKPTGTIPFQGSVQLPSGLVILVPYNSLVVGLFDPATNTYTAGPAHGQGTNAYRGAVLLPSGKVLFCPYNAANLGIYDPVANTFTAGPAHGLSFTGTRWVYSGIVLGADDIVYLIPAVGTTLDKYNYLTNTFSIGPTVPIDTTSRTGPPFCGGVLLPNGDIWMCVFNNNYSARYRPSTNTVTLGTTLNSSTSIYSRPSLHLDGRIWMAKEGSQRITVCDPTADTYSDSPIPPFSSDVGSFRDVLPLPDGKVLALPKSSEYMGIYNPATTTWTQGAQVNATDGTSWFAGGRMMIDQRVLLLPSSKGNFGLYTYATGGLPLPAAYLTSRYAGNKF